MSRIPRYFLSTEQSPQQQRGSVHRYQGNKRLGPGGPGRVGHYSWNQVKRRVARLLILLTFSIPHLERRPGETIAVSRQQGISLSDAHRRGQARVRIGERVQCESILLKYTNP